MVHVNHDCNTYNIKFILISSGVYPHGAENHKYVDFVYVGGTQNPKSDPVPKGSLKLTALLPDGQYDYRYL